MNGLLDSDAFNHRLFFPRPDFVPASAGAEDLHVEVPGANLHLRWHRSPAAPATLLLFHGNGEVVSDYDSTAAEFRRAGAELVVVDFRGYGASTGSPTLRSAMEDAPKVLATVLERAAGKPVVVMGRSLGSACAAELYGAEQPAAVRGVIFESGFLDLAALVRRREMQPPSSFDAETLARFDPVPKLMRGRLPLLVIHGAKDTAISPDEGRNAYEVAGGSRKELVLILGRGHNDVSASPVYWERLARFVAECCEGHRKGA